MKLHKRNLYEIKNNNPRNVGIYSDHDFTIILRPTTG